MRRKVFVTLGILVAMVIYVAGTLLFEHLGDSWPIHALRGLGLGAFWISAYGLLVRYNVLNMREREHKRRQWVVDRLNRSRG